MAVILGFLPGAILVTKSGVHEISLTGDGTYASYKTIHFGPNIQKSAAPWADPSGDGVSNLLISHSAGIRCRPPARVSGR